MDRPYQRLRNWVILVSLVIIIAGFFYGMFQFGVSLRNDPCDRTSWTRTRTLLHAEVTEKGIAQYRTVNVERKWQCPDGDEWRGEVVP